MLRKRILSILATVAMAAGLIAIVASPAAASYSDCPIGALCLYDGSAGGAPRLIWYTEQGWGGSGCQNLAPSINDRTTSITNGYATHNVTLYAGGGCTTEFLRPAQSVPHGTRIDQLAGAGDSTGTGTNNQVSSIYFS